MYASWNVGEVHYLLIDAATGLPIDAGTQQPTLGTTNPVDGLFASDLSLGPLGLDFDPITHDLFLATSQGDPLNTIFQIGGFVGTPTTSTTSTTTTTTTLPGTCSPAVSFESTLCRLDLLATQVQGLGDIGAIAARLNGKLTNARGRTTAA